MHPHKTQEARRAHDKAIEEWYEERYRTEVECYTLRGAFRELWPMFLTVGIIFVGIAWFVHG